jgi:hypothetical protein
MTQNTAHLSIIYCITPHYGAFVNKFNTLYVSSETITHSNHLTHVFFPFQIHHLGFHTNYTLTDLIYDRTYYFTVFALNEMRVYTQYASTTFKYQKPKPFALKDAKPRIENLRAHSGKASFRYKVGGLFSSRVGTIFYDYYILFYNVGRGRTINIFGNRFRSATDRENPAPSPTNCSGTWWRATEWWT